MVKDQKDFAFYPGMRPTQQQAVDAARHLDEGGFVDNFGGFETADLVRRARTRGVTLSRRDVEAVLTLLDYVLPFNLKRKFR